MRMKRMMLILSLVVAGLTNSMAQEASKEQSPKRSERQWAGCMGGECEIPIMQLSKELALTKEQQSQMRAIFTASTNEMRTLHAKMIAAAKMQAELMSQDSPNEELVMKGADEVAAIRAEIGKIRIKQMLAAQKILTPEQRSKMREKMKSRMGQRGMGAEGFKHRSENTKKLRKANDADKTPSTVKSE
jgi:Spy/CpxP family protein refolding chaperone